jgi:hypothetical protein
MDLYHFKKNLNYSVFEAHELVKISFLEIKYFKIIRLFLFNNILY